MTNTGPRITRIKEVIRDFFKDKPVGTSISDEALAHYRKKLREAAVIRKTDTDV